MNTITQPVFLRRKNLLAGFSGSVLDTMKTLAMWQSHLTEPMFLSLPSGLEGSPLCGRARLQGGLRFCGGSPIVMRAMLLSIKNWRATGHR